MIKTVLLDLDDTIFDFKSCERQALSRSLDRFAVTYDDAMLQRYSVINDMMWKKLEKGEITREVLLVKRFEQFLGEYCATEVSPAAFADTYMEELSKTGVLLHDAIWLLSWLSERYSLYAVTNGYVVTQMGRIRTAGIAKYFKEIFISQSVGYVKPSRSFFDYCQEKTGFDPEETVLIGDSLTSDIRGGVEYGIYTIWFNPLGKECLTVSPDAEVRSLREIPPLLRSLL